MGSERRGRGLRPVDRLRTSREFQRVSRRGRRFASRHFVVLVAPRPSRPTTAFENASGRIGLTVSRRVGGAVVRNRLKRRLREWFRNSSIRAAGALDWVLIARPGAAGSTGSTLGGELEAICETALGELAQ